MFDFPQNQYDNQASVRLLDRISTNPCARLSIFGYVIATHNVICLAVYINLARIHGILSEVFVKCDS